MILWGETSGAPTYTSPRYAGMILKRLKARIKELASPRYAGMILENHLLKMVNLPSPRYAGMIPEAPGPMF